MTKTEKKALGDLKALLNEPQHQDQLPIARKLINSLDLSLRLHRWSKRQAKVEEAIEEYNVSPTGPGETDPKYKSRARNGKKKKAA